MSYSEVMHWGNLSYKCDHCPFATPHLSRITTHNGVCPNRRIVSVETDIVRADGEPFVVEEEETDEGGNSNIVDAEHLGD